MSEICKICGVDKNISDFYSGRKTCKDCTNAAARKIRVEQPERYAKYKKRNKGYLKEKRYGITQQQFDQILVDQNNKCKLCYSEFKNSKDTHIDHCHDQNRVRGLLCNLCNVGLGQFKDNVEYMYNAIKYLNK
jgi:hypothetical protein